MTTTITRRPYAIDDYRIYRVESTDVQPGIYGVDDTGEVVQIVIGMTVPIAIIDYRGVDHYATRYARRRGGLGPLEESDPTVLAAAVSVWRHDDRRDRRLAA